MSLIGFKKMTIGIHDKVTGIITEDNVFVIEGKEGKGATTTANISGLSAEPKKVYGSDILYHVIQKGVGEVEAEFGVIDMPSNLNDKILGYKSAGEDEIVFIGEDTEPPYVTVILESETMSGDTALFALLKGKFGKESIEFATKEGENVTPEADSYKLSCMASDKEGELKDQTVAKYFGTTQVEAFKTLIMPTVPAI